MFYNKKYLSVNFTKKKENRTWCVVSCNVISQVKLEPAITRYFFALSEEKVREYNSQADTTELIYPGRTRAAV